jgi:tetratricopeptide (TPR) repeat protein
VGAAPPVGPVSEFCAKLDELRVESGADVPLLARRLGLSRTQLYTILAGRIKRPPDWSRIVRPFVDVCSEGSPAALAAWRQRHAILTDVWEELRRRDRQAAPTVRIGQAGRVSPADIPRELPPAAAHFTGRARELATLTRLLDRSHQQSPGTVVISAIGGTAGVGKTELAVQWAHQVADRFPDGQLYVNLHGFDPAEPVPMADALAGLLRSLGVPGADIPDGTDDRTRLYRSKLAGQQILVLLDNASDGEQVRPLLPGDPGCLAVVTSRDQLAGLVAVDGAKRLDLDLLPPRDAVALLRSLIGSRVDDEPEAAAALAGLCARLPLALRIAAEQAAARGSVRLAELAAELAESQLDTLDAGEDRADVRAVFSWSYRHLPRETARTFTLLGLHPGEDMDIHSVAALTGMSPRRARHMLGLLHRASLLQTTSRGRYEMHDLLRVYAREQAAEHDPPGSCQQALTRLFDYYLAAAAAAMDRWFPAETHLRPRNASTATPIPAMPDQASARTWLDSERVNLVAVTTYCATHGWPEHVASLAATLRRYLLTSRHLPEAVKIYHHALQTARQSGDLTAEAAALTGLGSIDMRKGRFPDAACHYHAALEQYRSCGDRAGEARVLGNLGIIDYRLHDYRSALCHYQEAIAAHEDARDHLGMAGALCYLAGAEIELGSLEEASGHLLLALQVFRDEKHPTREAEALSTIGELYLRRGQLTQASDSYHQALTIYRHIDSPAGIAAGLGNLGEVSLRQGAHHQAITYLQQAITLFRQASDSYGEIFARRTLAQALNAAKQPAAARAELQSALQLAADIGNAYQQASTHRDLAESHRHDGQDNQARYHQTQAHTLYPQADPPRPDRAQPPQ